MNRVGRRRRIQRFQVSEMFIKSQYIAWLKFESADFHRKGRGQTIKISVF